MPTENVYIKEAKGTIVNARSMKHARETSAASDKRRNRLLAAGP